MPFLVKQAYWCISQVSVYSTIGPLVIGGLGIRMRTKPHDATAFSLQSSMPTCKKRSSKGQKEAFYSHECAPKYIKCRARIRTNVKK